MVRARGRPCGPPSGPTLAALRPGRPGGPAGRPSGRPFFEGRPERRPFFCKGRPHFEGGRPVGGPSAMVAARSETAGRPSGRPILEGGRPLFSGGPPELGQRAAPFGGWAAPVAAGLPAHQLGPIRPLTAHRFLTRRGGAPTRHTDKRDKSRVYSVVKPNNLILSYYLTAHTQK